MEEDFVFASDGGGHSEEDDMFDTIVGAIQNILVDGGDSEFTKLMNNFLGTYSVVFEEGEENKLEYMDIFKKYSETIEGYIETKLSQQIEDFTMSALMELLQTRDESDLQGDVFELLYSFSDFNLFKEHMLDYKKTANTRNNLTAKKCE